MREPLVETLCRVGAQPLPQGVEAGLRLADRLWYGGDRPVLDDLDAVRCRLSAVGFRRVLCVLELLSLFPVCERETARAIQAMLRGYHERDAVGASPPLATGRVSFSARWRLSESTVPLRRALLPRQTRHYAERLGHERPE